MDLKSFAQAIRQIADEKGIPREKILETIEMALAAAYKRDYGKRGQIVRVKLEPETGSLEVRQTKIVVDETMIKSEEEIKAEEEERAQILSGAGAEAEREAEKEEIFAGEERRVRFNPEKHIMLDEAKKVNPEAKAGDELEFELETRSDFGRIAAQTAKQVIIQRLREVEREAIYEEYKEKEGELASGIIQRIDGKNVFVDLGRTVAVLPPEEQVLYERYRVGTRLKGVIILVEKNPKGPGIFISRSHPRLLKKLFELEVPEIANGTVEIKAIAREPGSRSKVAVASNVEDIDPVGSLVGQKGIRVAAVINELGGEKIDVIEWSENTEEFIANSISPAKALEVKINSRKKEAQIAVADEQLSLAIGKGGQNVRLAAKLTGWRIDVRSAKSAASGEETEEENEKTEEAAEAGATEENGDTAAPETAETKETEEIAEKEKTEAAKKDKDAEEKSKKPKRKSAKTEEKRRKTNEAENVKS